MDTATISSLLASGILDSTITNNNSNPLPPPTVKMQDLHPPSPPSSVVGRQSTSPSPSFTSINYTASDIARDGFRNSGMQVSGDSSLSHFTLSKQSSPGDSKSSRKRKSWGQELPEPKTNLPPRKRAKTEDEKEQRRIERVKRNRLAAHNSRERKRHEVELLQVEKDELEQRLRSSEQDLTSLMDCMRKMAAQIEAYRQYVPESARVDDDLAAVAALPKIPKGLTISEPASRAATATTGSTSPTSSLLGFDHLSTTSSTSTINPRQASYSSPEPQLSSGIDSPLDTSSQPATPSEATSPMTMIPPLLSVSEAAAATVAGDESDKTQHSAAMLYDPQCRSDSSTLTMGLIPLTTLLTKAPMTIMLSMAAMIWFLTTSLTWASVWPILLTMQQQEQTRRHQPLTTKPRSLITATPMTPKTSFSASILTLVNQTASNRSPRPHFPILVRTPTSRAQSHSPATTISSSSLPSLICSPMCARLPDESATNVASQQGVYGRGSDGRLMSELESVKCDGRTGRRVDGCEWEYESLEKGEGLFGELNDFLSKCFIVKKGDVGFTNGTDGFLEAFGYDSLSGFSYQFSSRRGTGSDGSRRNKYISTLLKTLDFANKKVNCDDSSYGCIL